ncbi:MAG: 16S rRNA processing protein RimM, partial [Spirochaetales bacterium]|nr:16S rRNA processing protein RimM [Spirochaetales bacterium]
SIRASGSTVFVKLKGIDNPEVGKTYAGWDIWASRESAASLDTDEYYLKDLNGCDIVNSGEVLGKIIGISENSVNDLLEVKTDKGVFIIPFRDEFIGNVDVDSHKVEIKALWLLQ